MLGRKASRFDIAAIIASQGMFMTKFSFALRAAATASLSLTVNAQDLLFDLPGEAAGNRFGYSVAGIGDVNGDSTPDWAAGAPFSDENGSMSGSVRVFSGLDGSELFEFLGDSAGDLFGSSVAGGDVNGDGRADLIVGAYGDDVNGVDSGSLFVYSGLDGSLLFSEFGSAAGDNLGFSVAFVPDVDNDGFGEVLAGAWVADTNGLNDGEALLFDGTDGSLLQTFTGQNAFDFFGYSVAGLEDVNGDGFGDVIIGAPGNGFNGSGSGSAYVYSGASGRLLRRLRGDATGDGFGSAVADAGDLNADGLNDYFVGAPGSDSNLANAGQARVFSSVDGAVIYSISGDFIGDNLGVALAGNFDVTEDGITDLLIGAIAADPNGANSGVVKVISGADGSLFDTMVGENAGDRFGASIAFGGDTNGDSVSEVLIGAWGEDPGMGAFTGGMHAVSFGSGPISYTYNYCMAMDNSTGGNALMSSTGSTSLALNEFSLTCSGVVPNVPGLFFYGPNEIQTPFGDGFRCVGGQVFRTNTTTSDALGDATVFLDLQNQDAEGEITGASVWKFQFWYRDTPAMASGFNLSDGLSVTFLP